MGIDNTAGHWGAVAKAMHWSIALLVFLQIGVGRYADELKETMIASGDRTGLEGVIAAFDLHKSIGLVIALLVIARIVWRVTHYVPPLSGEMPRALRAFAHITHWGLYGFLLTMVTSGFVIAQASSRNTMFFNLFELPRVFAASEGAREVASMIHGVSVWVLSILIVLHIAAALFHHFALKDDTMVKMLPAFLGGRGGPARPSVD